MLFKIFRKSHLLLFLSVFGAFLLAFQNKSVYAKTKEVILKGPHNKETVNIVNQETLEWWKGNHQISWKDFNKKKRDIAKTKKVNFRWKKLKGYQTYVFELGLSPNFLKCRLGIKKEITGNLISPLS